MFVYNPSDKVEIEPKDELDELACMNEDWPCMIPCDS